MGGQKLVVALLCFWYEEWKRWCRLQREERDFREQIEIAKRVGNRRGLSFFSVELNKVLRQKRLLWSEREENREVVGSLGTVAGPSGSERHGREESTTVDDQLPIATGGAARVMSSGGVDELPNYGELSAEGVADDDHEHEEMLTANATDELPSRVVDHLPSHQNS
ncbi:hypothetical protein EYC84_007705 [Monilinia fructicola]|uniref:Uncharacterized protein n=1 Tax=Monilinia fructicola TaxID=38448 RepID=A0A5M9JH13_MONFR|nr:hypothetical protein EYC84_007705 [Monilinia fructicola]